MISNGSSKLLFTCAATVKNKNLVNKTVVLEPMYSVKWENNWPILINSNLLQIKNIEYTRQSLNKNTIKLKAVHSLVHEKSLTLPHNPHIVSS